jgi:signal transduction histidine kinase
MMNIDERRRLERALHDGAQQDLIAISVRLQLLRRLVAGAEAIALLDELQRDAHDALDRLRELANDVYPSTLDVWGLAHALRELARPAGVTVVVEVGRYPAAVEAAVYFAARDLLDGARALTLREEDGALVLSVEPSGASERFYVSAR